MNTNTTETAAKLFCEECDSSRSITICINDELEPAQQDAVPERRHAQYMSMGHFYCEYHVIAAAEPYGSAVYMPTGTVVVVKDGAIQPFPKPSN